MRLSVIRIIAAVAWLLAVSHAASAGGAVFIKQCTKAGTVPFCVGTSMW